MARQKRTTGRRARSSRTPAYDPRDHILIAVRSLELAESTMTTAALALRQQNADDDAAVARVLFACCDRLSARREELQALWPAAVQA